MAGAVGTVDTLAGPGFCPGAGLPDAASGEVGALAVDPSSGALWFENSGAGRGGVTLTRGTHGVEVFDTRVEWGPTGRTSPEPALSPSRLAVDPAGVLLVASPSGIVIGHTATPLAGTAVPAPGVPPAAAGDGGPISSARFASVVALVATDDGSLFVADELDEQRHVLAIRFLNRGDQPRTFFGGTRHEVTVAPGNIDTIAGGPAGSGRAVEGLVGRAPAMAVADDRLYLTTSKPGSTEAVDMVNLGDRPLTLHAKTVAAAGVESIVTLDRPGGDGAGVVARAGRRLLGGIAVDPEGNLFIAEPANHRVRRVDAGGKDTVHAGTGRAGFNGSDRPATTALLNRPYAVAVGASGRLYISDAGNDQVRVVDGGGTIRSAPGNGAADPWRCVPPKGGGQADQPVANAEPTHLAVGEDGAVHFSLRGIFQVKALSPRGRVNPAAGRPPGACPDAKQCVVGDDAPPDAADLSGLKGVAAARGGGVYILEQHRVRLLNVSERPLEAHGVTVPGGALRTIAGYPPGTEPAAGTEPPADVLGPPVPAGRKAIGTSLGLGRPRLGAMAADSKGNLFLAAIPDGSIPRSAVRQVDPEGNVTEIVPPHPGIGPDGLRIPDCCAQPAGLAVDGRDNLYIADVIGSRVWYLNRGDAEVAVHGVSVAPGAIEAVAGAGLRSATEPAGTPDDAVPALDARLQPSRMAIDGKGNLYVTAPIEHVVRRVDARGIIVTVAGFGQSGFNGNGLKGPLTALSNPSDIAFDGCGNLLIADAGNDRVRRLNLVPSCAAVAASNDSGPAGRLAIVTATAAAVLAALVAVAVMARRRRSRPASGGSDG